MVIIGHPAVYHYLIITGYPSPLGAALVAWKHSLSLLVTMSLLATHPHPPVVKCTLALLVILPVGAALVVW